MSGPAGSGAGQSEAWRSWEGPAKLRLRNRLAEACARVGTPLGDAPDSLTLATTKDPRQVVARPHLEPIAQAFADVHARLIDRVIITTPPQVGKTVGATWGVFWWLTHHPKAQIILASYGSQLASTRGRMVRRLVRDHGAGYGLRVDPEHSAISDWALTSGGGMRTAGMDSGVTGNPADLLLLDDPHKNRAEADSPIIRNAIWDVYSSSLLSRLSPGAPVILVLTRWHPDDLAARVMREEGIEAEGGRWRLIHMPALATSPADPLGRAVGEPLTHPKIEVDDVEAALAHWRDKRATSTLRDWFALYQGDPVPAEGALLTEEIIRQRRTVPPPDAGPLVGVAVDPSGGGRDEAGVVGGHIADDGKLYWTHDRSDVMSSDEWSRAACLLAYEIGADRLICESNFGADMARLALRTAWDALTREGEVDGPCPRIVMVNSRRGKFLRAEPIAQQVKEDRARFGALLPDFEHDWITWQPGSPWSPGRLDAGVHLAFALLKVPGSESVVSTVSDVPKEGTGRSATARRRITR